MSQADGDKGLGMSSVVSIGGMDKGATTLARFVSDDLRKHATDSLELVQLLNSITVTVKTISSSLRTGSFSPRSDLGVGLQGDQAKKAADVSSELMGNVLKASCATCLLISEATGKVMEVEQEKSGKYVVAFDALEGSADPSCLGMFGTIFAIYRKNSTGPATEQDALRPGCEITAAGYAVYSAATVLVLSTGRGVNGFTLDTTVGDFFLSLPNIRCMERGNIYGINEDHTANCDAATTEYVQGKKCPEVGTTTSHRHTGCIAADVHDVLCGGGILIYPATGSFLRGTIGLVTQGNAIAFLMLHAGGHASTGRDAVLLVKPQTIQDRVPVFLGSKHDVEDLKALHRKPDSHRLDVKVDIFLNRKNASLKRIAKILDDMREKAVPTLQWTNAGNFQQPQPTRHAADFRSVLCYPFLFLSADDPELSVRKPPRSLKDDFYEVSNSARGLLFLIMITDFLDGKDYRSNLAVEADYMRLGSLFRERGYGVLVLRNLLKAEFISAAEHLARISVSYESCWMIVQSHGVMGEVAASDEYVPVKDLLAPFSGVLKGKPKIFIFDNCRKIATSTKQDGDVPKLNGVKEDDFFVGYSTSPDEPSLNLNQRGSFFAQAFVNCQNRESVPLSFEAFYETTLRDEMRKLLKEHAARNNPRWERIHRATAGIIPSPRSREQVPAVDRTLRKKFCF